MLTTDFDYHLPTNLIAQSPVTPRDHSKLMIVDRAKKTLEHKQFFDIVDYLGPNDLIVRNNSKVFKARLFGVLKSNKGDDLFEHTKKVEVFLIRSMPNPGVWKVLAKPGKHLEEGIRVVFADDFYCDVMIKERDGSILVQFPYDEASVRERANKYGNVPLPPYVKDEKHELESYQTVYASNEKEGSVAAPTAGFHFSKELISRLEAKGVQFAEVTLHVGLGTFLPVKAEKIEDHTMHSEWVELTEENAKRINAAKSQGKRVIALGTTSVRSLEGIAQLAGYHDKKFEAFAGDINMFITPGFDFKVIDGLITNFHLPKSTLLMLVSAFIGSREETLEIYKTAVEKEYRFFSFGDGMLIL